jgi:hypothetical protein
LTPTLSSAASALTGFSSASFSCGATFIDGR